MLQTHTALRFAAALSANPDSAQAGAQVTAQCGADLGAGPVDLSLLFVSSAHVAQIETIAGAVRRELSPRCLVGVSAGAVIGGATELEGAPGVSLLCARLPGVELVPFTTDDMQPYDDLSTGGRARLARAFGADEQLRATFLFADPFSVPVLGLLPAMGRCRTAGPDGRPVGAILGGMASATGTPGGNALVLDDAVYRGGGVGVSIRGPIKVNTIVSQGCRGFGPNFIVTAVRKNVILTLSGRPALEAVREVLGGLTDAEQHLVARGLYLGRVINEYKERFGRDDFLIRNVMGVDEASKSIAVSDFLRVGQTVRFHLRDATTADEDLAMLLDAQKLHEPPAGALLITCNGRGSKLFDRPGHDAGAVARAFGPRQPGEEKAKTGREFDADAGTIPLAGFFAAGEIGPVGDESFLHGHTACVALFRGEAAGRR